MPHLISLTEDFIIMERSCFQPPVHLPNETDVWSLSLSILKNINALLHSLQLPSVSYQGIGELLYLRVKLLLSLSLWLDLALTLWTEGLEVKLVREKSLLVELLNLLAVSLWALVISLSHVKLYFAEHSLSKLLEILSFLFLQLDPLIDLATEWVKHLCWLSQALELGDGFID
jgi:hypothetical protein